jgi:hypothetical protein
MVNSRFVRHYPKKVNAAWAMKNPREVPSHPTAEKMLRVLTGQLDLETMDPSMMSDEERAAAAELLKGNYAIETDVKNPLPSSKGNVPSSYGASKV